ncbi:LOW QUALITY PROTEIN: cilia- and flagella-associated protein 43-like [Pomacea canaliculata]|uniref:LOW QUALITY PROTEIN: cilia- and flagella-associated protein 43-like n=1 Tax=Pomacea canaliculata TaxID=400727 RepID=UPI000D738081|nr:LOW QUALITY PROTEIN: cilia- and flagella-associated protein 43-like [Pomacea canaliculata]
MDLVWTQGYYGQELFYIDTDVICYQCGRNVNFVHTDGTQKVFAFCGQGVGPFSAHKINQHFAIAERCIGPKIFVYSYPSLEELMILVGGAETEFQRLAFSSSNFLLSLSSIPDFQMALWDYTTGKKLTSVKLTSDPITSVGFNPANWRQICVTTKSTVTVWNVEQSNVKYILLPQKVCLPPEDPSVSNDNEKELETNTPRASTKSSKYEVKVPLTAVAGLVGEMADHLQEFLDTTVRVSPVAQAWTPIGDIYISCTSGHLLKVNGETYKVCPVFYSYSVLSRSGSSYSSRGPSISQKESRGVSGEFQGEISKAVSLTCLGYHGMGLFAVGDDGILHLLDTVSEEMKVLEAKNLGIPITALTFSYDYTNLVLGSPKGTIYLLEVEKDLDSKILLHVHYGEFVDIGSLPKGSESCVTVRGDGMVQAWSALDGHVLSSIALGEPASCLVSSPIAFLVVVGSTTGYLYFLDFTDEKKPRIVHRTRLYCAPVKQLIFDCSGTYLIAAGEDKNVFLMNGCPSSYFSVLGYTEVLGDVQHITTTTKKDLILVGIAVCCDTKQGSSWDQIIWFEIKKNFVRDLKQLYHSKKCDLKDEGINKKDIYFQNRLFGCALGEGGIVYGIGRSTRKIIVTPLPEEVPKKKSGSQWLESPESKKMFDGHQLRGGKLMLSPHLQFLISYGPDGAFMLREVVNMEQTLRVIAHDYHRGGVKALAITHDCNIIFTIGHDGALCCFEWRLDSKERVRFKIKTTEKEARKDQTIVKGQENDALCNMRTWLPPVSVQERKERVERKKQESMEKEESPLADQPNSTWLEQKELEILRAEEKQYAETKKNLRAQIRDIRKTIQHMMRKNEELPDIEKLSRHEFDLDVDEQARLQAEGEAEIEKVREEIQFDNLAKLYLREVIKKECWDDMKVKGRSLQAFNSNLEVANFPLKERSPQTLKKLEAVSARRRIEMKELMIRKTEVELGTRPAYVGEEENEGEEDGGSKEQPCITGGLGASYGGGSALFYSQFDLHLRHQKANQIVLLEDAIHRIKVTFNRDFDDIFLKKEQEMAKMREKNKRIIKILSDLDLNEPVIDPEMSVMERPEQLLTVDDNEVTVERFLTPEQRKKLEEQQRLEEERRLREKGDNQRERALDMMMGGVLEIRKEDELKKDIPVPLFMQQKESTEWTEEEQKLVKDYERRCKELNEEREKFRKQLETELRKLQAQIKEGMAAFDETLNQLFLKKIKVMMVIYQEELKILRLRRSLLIEEELDTRERELSYRMNHKRELRQLASEAVVEARINVDEFRNQYDILVAEDKVMDKAFKREFSDLSAVMADHLYRVFRKRPRGLKFKAPDTSSELVPSNPFAERPSTAQQNAQTKLLLEAALDELDKPANMPEGLDPTVWQRLCNYRRAKIESENMVKKKALVLAEMQAFLQKRVEEDEALKSEVDAIGIQLAKLKDDQLLFTLDLEVQLLLKQGQVEVDAGQFIHDYNNSVLIHRSVVEDLNATIKQLGESKIASMMESKDFRKGIIQLEWEHKKMSMEMEDLENKMKDIMFMKVTREIQAFLNESDYDAKKASEISTLEQTILMQRKHHEKNVQTKEHIKEDLRSFLKRKKTYNTALDKELEELNVCVNERRHIDEVNAERRLDTGKEKRYRDIIQRRKLVDLAKAQAQEVAVLRAEVERLRMRTFPALVQVEH